LLKIAPDEFLRIIQLTEKEKISFYEAERRLEVPNHGYLGEYIANQWRLPMVIRMCVRYHHADVRKMDTILASMKNAVQIVALANEIMVKENIGFSGNASGGNITDELLAPLGLSASELPPLIERIKKEIDNASGFLGAAA
jgi:hypothetical protein